MRKRSSKQRAARIAQVGACGLVALGLLLLTKPLQDAALRDRDGWPPEDSFIMLPPPEAVPFVAAGYRELAADALWARALVYYGSHIAGDEEFRYLSLFIDDILTLDPHFKRVYGWAAAAVTYRTGTATQEEFLMSADYLERAILAFPDGYEFFWSAGNRYFFDLRPDDPELRFQYRARGAELMEQATRKDDAPEDLATTAAAMRTHLGQQQRAMHVLKQKLLTTEDEEARQAMMMRFRYLADDDTADALAAVTRRFDALAAEHAPNLPANFFVLVGPRPDPVIRFENLATDRDLFGAESPSHGDAEIDLFPDRPRPAPAATEPPGE